MIGMGVDKREGYRRAMADDDRRTEAGEMQKRVEAISLAAAPAIAAAAEALAPALNVIVSATRQVRQFADTITATLRSARRPAARKPCTWCSNYAKRPAVFTVKWREPVVWWDEFDGTPTFWEAGRRMRMCEFHARIAERYNGVKTYRFRRLK